MKAKTNNGRLEMEGKQAHWFITFCCGSRSGDWVVDATTGVESGDLTAAGQFRREADIQIHTKYSDSLPSAFEPVAFESTSGLTLDECLCLTPSHCPLLNWSLISIDSRDS